MLGFWIIVCHLVGDYLLQSDWMAQEKTKKSLAALAHAVTYTLPFLFLTRDPLALGFIAGTHFMIDRWRLARYVCYAKNFLAPKVSITIRDGYAVEGDRWWHPWEVCSTTGYHSSRPPWLAVWLLIIADNTLHLICNGIAFVYPEALIPVASVVGLLAAFIFVAYALPGKGWSKP